MCQAYAAEASFVASCEDSATEAGWKAHRNGLPRSTEYFHPYYQKEFREGWDSRDEKFIPWPLAREFRKQQEEQTGKACFTDPTVAEADLLV